MEPTSGESWNSARWLAAFREASALRDGPRLRALRVEVFRGTVQAVRARSYRCGDGSVPLDARDEYERLHRATAFYASTDDLVVGSERRGRFATEVRVVHQDCLEVVAALADGEIAPLVLNMGSARNPGGAVHRGAGAQEENLFRRSTLLRSLYQFVHYASEYDVRPHPGGVAYPIPRESGGIYSPPAAVFRSSEATGYSFLAKPFESAFLTVPAISSPEVVTRDGETRLVPRMAEATRRKILAIFRIAARHGHADLVLSAFGCGAFRNPPRHIAQLFREVLDEPELSGAFRRIVFAVLDDHNAVRPDSPEGNYRPFADVLEQRLVARD